MTTLKTTLLFLLLTLTAGAIYAQRQNLGPHINTEYNESAPVISPTGNELYFWSMGREDGIGFQDVYLSKQDLTGNAAETFMVGADQNAIYAFNQRMQESFDWTPSRNIGSPINNAEANIVLAITQDGSRLLVYNKSGKEGYSDIGFTQKQYGSWESPRNLRIDGYNNPGGSSVTACLSGDEKHMIISLDDGTGNEDLYVFDKLGEGAYGNKRKLTSVVNTAKDEITPFLSPDGRSLYFSSDGHRGQGGLDIFMTRRLDDTWTAWSEPQNAGRSINSAQDDYYFNFPSSGNYAYFTSKGDDSKGLKDIYRTTIPLVFRPNDVFTVKGKVQDHKNSPLNAKVVFLRKSTGEIVGTATTNPATGDYTMLLPTGELYTIVASNSGYLSLNEEIDAAGAASGSTVNKDITLKALAVGDTIRLSQLKFGSGSFVIEPQSFPELDRMAKLLKDNPSMTVEINGHTDHYGEPEANAYFSSERAKSVKQYFVEQGIADERLTTVGLGSTQPIAPQTLEGSKLNRRVELKILTK